MSDLNEKTSLIAAGVVAALAVVLFVLPGPAPQAPVVATSQPDVPPGAGGGSAPSAGQVAPGEVPPSREGVSVPRRMAAEDAPALLEHRAIYRMRLVSASAASGLVGVDGGIIYRFADACDGWVLQNRTQLAYLYSEGRETETGWNFSTWESKEGDAYRFTLRQTVDGEIIEEVLGSARLSDAGSGGTARFKRPEDRTLPLPPGTLFPTRHMERLIALARAGESGLVRPVFDGGGEESLFEVSAVIGRPREASRPQAKGGEALAERPSWDIRLAYFPVGGHAPEPEYELTVRYRDDGVATRIVQEFKDFVMEGTLDRIEPLPPGGC